MENKENTQLQGRREFFKEAARKALPIIGAIALVNSPIMALATKKECSESNDCENSCTNTCWDYCTSCKGNCEGGCKDECTSCLNSCRSGCGDNCTSACIKGCFDCCF